MDTRPFFSDFSNGPGYEARLHAQCEELHAAVEHGKFQMQNPPRVHQLNNPLTPLCLDLQHTYKTVRTNLGLRFNQSEDFIQYLNRK